MSSKSLPTTELKKLLNFHLSYVNFVKSLKNKYKLRRPNFPEIISENIVKQYIINKELRVCENINGGDLISDGKKIEVKCFSTESPTSFGPTESWKELFFLDATDICNNKIKIYKCLLSHDSEEFCSIKISNNETIQNSRNSGKRPRIIFKRIKEQLGDNMKNVYSGDLENIFYKEDIDTDSDSEIILRRKI